MGGVTAQTGDLKLFTFQTNYFLLTDRQAGWTTQPCRQTGRESGRQVHRQKDRQVDRQVCNSRHLSLLDIQHVSSHQEVLSSSAPSSPSDIMYKHFKHEVTNWFFSCSESCCCVDVFSSFSISLCPGRGSSHGTRDPHTGLRILTWTEDPHVGLRILTWD